MRCSFAVFAMFLGSRSSILFFFAKPVKFSTSTKTTEVTRTRASLLLSLCLAIACTFEVINRILSFGVLSAEAEGLLDLHNSRMIPQPHPIIPNCHTKSIVTSKD